MKNSKLHLLILICALPLLHGCTKYSENPNRPILPNPITIYPNQMQYQNLHTIGGWEYITSEIESTSRGIIVFRRPDADNLDDTFAAYDRIPPNEPDACTDSQGNTTRMIVDYPFVVDRCNNAYYNILNGQIIIREPDMITSIPTDDAPVYNLLQYLTTFDGSKLTIYN